MARATRAASALTWCCLLGLRWILVAADPPCEVLTISPSSGPSDGGTLVNLTGVALGDGSAWRCRFGDVLVGAEYLDEVERVSCFSPRQPTDNVELRVNVSIDGGKNWEPCTNLYKPVVQHRRSQFGWTWECPEDA